MFQQNQHPTIQIYRVLYRNKRFEMISHTPPSDSDGLVCVGLASENGVNNSDFDSNFRPRPVVLLSVTGDILEFRFQLARKSSNPNSEISYSFSRSSLRKPSFLTTSPSLCTRSRMFVGY